MRNIESFILSLSVFIPLLSWILRYKNAENGYAPFRWLIILAAFAEIASQLCTRFFKTNAVVINVYSLAECMIILYQFYYWRKNKITLKWISAIAIVCFSVWFSENIIAGNITSFGPVFRITYAFFLVLLTINEINYLITHQNRRLLTNAHFMICLAFLIFFLYQILSEASLFLISIKENSLPVSNKILELAFCINLFVNLLYAVAVWLIPKKNSFNFNKSN